MAYNDVKEEIKRRINIVEVISEYVPLTRAGRRMKARCPFHQEKTPSFFVDPIGGFWHCFGCGAGGDVFSFVMQIEGTSFPEAGQQLAEQVGLTWRSAPGDQARVERRKLLRRAVKMAAQYFTSNLHSPRGRAALCYLQERGFSSDTISRFELGLALDSWEGLFKHLSGKGIAPEIMREAGLIKQGAEGHLYDVFRNRIMFAITDAAGAGIAFGGRATDPDESAKYLNSPDTPLFNKSQHLYGLAQARQAMVAEKRAIVVEGYTDVLALHQAGVQNTVATLGTAMTPEHLALLRRYVDEVILCYDADAAGMQAALRNISLFEGGMLEARVLTLPEGADPDEYVREYGGEQFAQLTRQAIDLVDYRLGMVFRQQRDGGARSLARAARQAVDVLRQVPDRTRRDEFIVRAADRWSAGQPERAESMEAALRLELHRRASMDRGGGRSPSRDSQRDRSFIAETIAQKAEQGSAALEKVEQELLCVALEDGALAEEVFAVVSPDDFLMPAHCEIAQAIVRQLQNNGEYDPHRIPDEFGEKEGIRQCAVELLLAELPADFDGEMLQADARKLRKHRVVTGLHERYEVQSSEMLSLTAEGPAEDFHKLQQRIIELVETGELTHEHPDYQKFLRLAESFRGKGQFDFFKVPGLLTADRGITEQPRPPQAHGETTEEGEGS